MQDEYQRRKQLSFAQAEGAQPLPGQLLRKELSAELRAQLWFLIYESMKEARDLGSYGAYLERPWSDLMYVRHVLVEHLPADEFNNDFQELSDKLKSVLMKRDYVAVFDLIQWLLRRRPSPLNPRIVDGILEQCGAAYRLLDDNETIVPISSEEERATLNRAFADLAGTEWSGARAHLRKAAEALTSGKHPDSIRESIHSVESVARKLGGTNSLAGALQRLKSLGTLHSALEQSFKSLYGYTSDEKGIRHPLID